MEGLGGIVRGDAGTFPGVRGLAYVEDGVVEAPAAAGTIPGVVGNGEGVIAREEMFMVPGCSST